MSIYKSFENHLIYLLIKDEVLVFDHLMNCTMDGVINSIGVRSSIYKASGIKDNDFLDCSV